jgi:hypothetical protein
MHTIIIMRPARGKDLWRADMGFPSVIILRREDGNIRDPSQEAMPGQFAVQGRSRVDPFRPASGMTVGYCL